MNFITSVIFPLNAQCKRVHSNPGTFNSNHRSIHVPLNGLILCRYICDWWEFELSLWFVAIAFPCSVIWQFDKLICHKFVPWCWIWNKYCFQNPTHQNSDSYQYNSDKQAQISTSADSSWDQSYNAGLNKLIMNTHCYLSEFSQPSEV